MATYWVTSTGAGAHSGVDLANAWTLQESFDALEPAGVGGNQLVEGDVVLCCADADLLPTATLECNPSSGTATNVVVDWIGANASGVVDGTKFSVRGTSLGAVNLIEFSLARGGLRNFVLDGAGNALHAFTTDGSASDQVFDSVDFLDSSTDDVVDMNGDSGSFYDCTFGGAPTGRYALDAIGRNSRLTRCLFRDNAGGTGHARSSSLYAMFKQCVFIGGTEGVRAGDTAEFDECLFDGCTTAIAHGGSDIMRARNTVFINCGQDYANTGTLLAYNCYFESVTTRGSGVVEFNTVAAGTAGLTDTAANPPDPTPSGSGPLAGSGSSAVFLSNGSVARDLGPVQIASSGGGATEVPPFRPVLGG